MTTDPSSRLEGSDRSSAARTGTASTTPAIMIGWTSAMAPSFSASACRTKATPPMAMPSSQARCVTTNRSTPKELRTDVGVSPALRCCSEVDSAKPQVEANATTSAAMTPGSFISASRGCESGGGTHGHRQRSDAVHDRQVVEPQLGRVDRQLENGEATGQGSQGDPQLHLPELGAHAAVQAVPERQVAVWCPVRVEGVGVGTERGVAVRAAQRAQHDVTLGDVGTVQRHVVAGDARERHLDDGEVSQQLVDDLVDGLVVLAEPRVLLGVLQ